jgi:iron complex outermembrane receptor protein
VVFDITDRLAVNAGLRYSSDEKIVDFDNTRVQNPNVVVKGNSTDWRVGLDFKWTDSFMTYASVATGYRPGSYNPRPFQATQVVAVDAEESLAYEIGFKSDLFDNQLRLNIAAFYTDWKTRITPVGGTECPLIDLGPPPVYVTVPEGTIDPTTGAPVTADELGNFCLNPKVSRTFYENTPGEITGAEVEFTWAVTEAMTLSGSYGYTDWESGDIDDDPTVVTDRPPYVPKDNWSVSAAYAFHMDGGSSVTPRLDLYGQSEICTQTVFTTSLFPGASCTDAYELLNARIEWASPDRAWTVAVGATNLSDEEYFLNTFDLTAFGQPHAEGQPGRPREWYVQFTRNFGNNSY